MFFAHLLIDALRGAVLLGFALAAMPLLRRATSAVRRLVLVLALGGALVIPFVATVAPVWNVETPAGVGSLRGIVVVEPPVEASAPVAASAGARGATMGAAPAGASARGRSRADWKTGLLVGWALGALLVVARLCVGVVKARAMVRRALPARSWTGAVAQAEAALGLRASVRMTDELDAPAVTGVFAPVVLVPRASESWSDARRCAVLLHELAHVRQGDCAAGLVAQIACAVHWFDPFAWLVARRLRLERELAADDAVVAAGARASTYAEDLLAIAGVAGSLRPVPSSALGMAEGSHLVARVTAIVSPTRARAPLTRARSATIVFGAATIVGLVACATPGGAPPATVTSAAAPAAPVAPNAPAQGESTIDPKIQAVADEEIDRLVKEWQPAAAAILVLDPSNGEIRANAGRAQGAVADVAVQRAYITGSTLKAFTLAAALEEGVLSPSESIDCGQGKWSYDGKVVEDAKPHGTLTVPQMLAVSSNIAVAKVFDRLGRERLERWLRAFHFASAPGIAGAASGAIPAGRGGKSFAGALLAIGESMTASPLQIAAGYAAIANEGVYVPPTASRRSGPAPREQIVKPETARTLVAMLDEAVNGDEGTGKLARVAGQRVAGKTGTAGWERPDGSEGVYSSFVGVVPSTAPRFVILVGVEQPRGGEESGGGKVAAPVFARIASRVLAP